MSIEKQIGKKYDRQETIKAINTNVVLANKHIQRLMYHIQIEGLDFFGDNELGGLRISLEQIIDKLKEEFEAFPL